MKQGRTHDRKPWLLPRFPWLLGSISDEEGLSQVRSSVSVGRCWGANAHTTHAATRLLMLWSNEAQGGKLRTGRVTVAKKHTCAADGNRDRSRTSSQPT